MVNELLLPLLEPKLGQAVLMGDCFILDSTQAQDQGAYDPRPVLAGGAVNEKRRRPLRRRCGKVLEDSGEGGVRVIRLDGGAQDRAIGVYETLRRGNVLSSAICTIREQPYHLPPGGIMGRGRVAGGVPPTSSERLE